MERFGRKVARLGYVLEQAIDSGYRGVRKVHLRLEPWSPWAYPAHSSCMASLEIQGPTHLSLFPVLARFPYPYIWTGSVGWASSFRAGGSSDLI